MMLGILLARAGVQVVVLEKHADFLRDFRGDTVHPSTLQILKEVGLLKKFDRPPQRKVDHLRVSIPGRSQQVIDFRGLKRFAYLSLVPQWDFLDLLADEGRHYPHFDLRMRHEAIGLIEKEGRVAGVRVHSPAGEVSVLADLIVACDGRHSLLREAASMCARVIPAASLKWFKRGFLSPFLWRSPAVVKRMWTFLSKIKRSDGSFSVIRGSGDARESTRAGVEQLSNVIPTATKN